MGNIFNRDFRDFIEALNHHEAEYILVGDYSVILHGYSRYTGDPDIWVNKTSQKLQSFHRSRQEDLKTLMTWKTCNQANKVFYAYKKVPQPV